MIRKIFGKLLAAVTMSGALLAATGTALGADVTVDAFGNVIRIENLEVILTGEDVAIYTVDFLDSTGADVWGPGEDGLDFNNEENVSSALLSVQEALNAEVPIPQGAGSSGAPVFWIAAEYDDGFYGVVGGEIKGGLWDQCDFPGCIASVKVPPLLETEQAVLADFTLTTSEPTSTTIASSNLPTSRSVQVGTVASAFGTIINTGDRLAEECGMSVKSPAGLQNIFEFQTVNELNVPIGQPNANSDIVEGGFQGYIFWFNTAAPIDPVNVQLNWDCANTEPAAITVGLNTVLLSASATPVPDILELAATPTADGILSLSGPNGSNAFAVSAANAGSAGTITVEPKPSAALLLAMSICETNPGTGECLSPPGPSATSSVGANATATYSVFVTAAGDVPFDPANNRINVVARDGGGVVRGSASVAVTTQ
jgi:hypothetical protein